MNTKTYQYINLGLMFFLIMLTTCKSCQIKNDISEVNSQVIELELANQTLTNSVDSLNGAIVSKEEIMMIQEIEGLKTSKRTLYDWNAVIRTTIRPDDRMVEYDQQIQSIQEELNK